MSPTYEVPLKVTGKIKLVTIEAKPGDLSTDDAKTLDGMKKAGAHD